MKLVPLDDRYFRGAVSVEHADGWVRPWRLPFDDLDLFISPGNALADRAREASGVRLRLATDSDRIGLRFLPLEESPMAPHHAIDLTLEGTLAASQPVGKEDESVLFEGLPGGNKTVDLWLPHSASIRLLGLTLDEAADCEPVTDNGAPKWVTYGSSLTHCRRAHSPARTWPAIVARRMGWDLTSLGYGGSCCLEPMIGLMIRDLPADLISLKLGINCVGGALSPRTFGAAALGLVQIIREKKPTTPILLISPIAFPPNETTPSINGNTIREMRATLEEVRNRLAARGDRNLHYLDGLKLFSIEESITLTDDQCHPKGDGIELMAEHFIEHAVHAFLREPACDP